jgi:putative phosphoribosyl transferase
VIFRDRRHAGQVLAAHLLEYAHGDDVLVLALPRGGVPVGYEVARRLGAPLDVYVVRKLGVPGHPELAMGAIASGGVRVLNDEIVQELGIGADEIERAAAGEALELQRREQTYRGLRSERTIAGKTILLVDDGLATGSTMRAAILALRSRHPARIVAAAPVAAPDSCAAVRAESDAVVCAETPERFASVGRWYADFEQTTDHEVRELLAALSPGADTDAAA